MDKANLEALLERVEKATGPDRAIDTRIWLALIEKPGSHERDRDMVGREPAYTASIDAALALVERMLPGAEYEITTIYGTARTTLPLNMNDDAGYSSYLRDDGDIPLSICGCLLKALIARADA